MITYVILFIDFCLLELGINDGTLSAHLYKSYKDPILNILNSRRLSIFISVQYILEIPQLQMI